MVSLYAPRRIGTTANHFGELCLGRNAMLAWLAMMVPDHLSQKILRNARVIHAGFISTDNCICVGFQGDRRLI